MEKPLRPTLQLPFTAAKFPQNKFGVRCSVDSVNVAAEALPPSLDQLPVIITRHHSGAG